ncbi:hypothetical protein BX616_003727 [Lobosporangium transversale]|uniref:Uncharacterized protein n=1 Tax=Lobosporangium transversale TaxID=64571 RepID=A0A1Y2GYJ0_9FUNG|nr:hypothetical protein BCR41DRAFT_368588 [Lobosporangium transversale]KAF9898684.1 hypothetical protein BX616_003727 [Lobosporangium transversale]ORZ26543.1 hypothetical protein BCR41DRAFT_368588 [Lobosporangium transversale]|eukprot:XP_021884308.1 hypothetical protein BCR41DRAFT_368588 [Lobosporangium transversale]
MAPLLKSLIVSLALASLIFANPLIAPAAPTSPADYSGFGSYDLGETDVPVPPIKVTPVTDFLPISNVQPIVNVLPPDVNDYSDAYDYPYPNMDYDTDYPYGADYQYDPNYPYGAEYDGYSYDPIEADGLLGGLGSEAVMSLEDAVL